MVFGTEISRCVSLQNELAGADDAGKCGLLGQMLHILGNQQQSKCFLSIVEVVDEDTFRDVLGFAYHELSEHDGHILKLRHFDHAGAVLENLHKMTVMNGQTMQDVIDAFSNETLNKIWSKEGGHGHFIAAISAEGGEMIQLVDCASADRQCSVESNPDTTIWKQKHDRRMTSIRKSLSSLRGGTSCSCHGSGYK